MTDNPKAPEIDTSAEAVERHMAISENHEAGLIPIATQLFLTAVLGDLEEIRRKNGNQRTTIIHQRSKIETLSTERDALQAEVERLRQTVRDMDAAAEAEAQKYEDHFYGHDQTRGCIECGAELASPSDTVCPNCLRTASMTGLEGGE